VDLNDVSVKLIREEMKDLEAALKLVKKSLAAVASVEKAADELDKSAPDLKQVSKVEKDV
jgi:hypothetical protein